MNANSWPRVMRWALYLPTRVAILVTLLCGYSMSSRGAAEGDFEYEVNSILDRVTIKRYVGVGGNIAIPEWLGGRPVRSIGPNTFSGLTNVSRVTIPSGVTSVGLGAFSHCTSLLSIDVDPLNPGLSSLDGVLFDKVQSLLFAFPAGKSGAYAIPNTVVRVMYKALSGCGGLTNVTFGSGVNTLEDLAFEDCSNLALISITHGVTSIGRSSFLGCTSLSSIEVDPVNPAYSSSDGVLLERSRAELFLFPQGRVGDYAVPNGITNLGAYAFWGCEKLTGISISNHVTSVGDFAFSGCAGLTNVVLSTSVKSIGAGAFGACSSLRSIEIPNSVTAIEQTSFQGCSSLTTITIPGSVTRIGDSAFWGCTSLEYVTMPDAITSIGNSAFIDCKSLVNFAFPDGITVIGDGLFQGCTGLKNVTIPNGITTIGTAAFTYCSSLTSVRIPDSVISIGDFGFGYCTALTDVRLPSALAAIPDHAFYGCSSLTNLGIPFSVTSIGNSAFGRCVGLSGVTIPSSVTFIGDHAFQYCTALTGLYFEGNPPLFSGDPLSSWPSPTFVTVFYDPGATGWTTTFAGRPTAVWAQRPDYAAWAVSIGLVSQFPTESDGTDDPDGDGFDNRSEWYSGTDPTEPASRLKVELTADPTALEPTDQTPVGVGQHAVYFRSVPGQYYGLQRDGVLNGKFELVDVRVASRTQTRFVVTAITPNVFYRIVTLP